MPFKSKTDNIVIKKMARWERSLFDALLLAAYALVLVRLWWPLPLPGKPGWLDAVLLLLAVAGTIASAASAPAKRPVRGALHRHCRRRGGLA